ncbi:RelA/SpoT domain-containing protein [Mycobacterium sp.]|uniref:RelA/SpoT domain-containing protein n=1 Tax=Mycobacterium sp. TaxID=1785 RepID=UPI002D8DF700|nr:GTP pyrophosphokinase family protein [Mycobacterium sp.]
MNLNEKPSWSRNSLKKLGEALVDEGDIPEGCPQYSEVMHWHNELASEVASRIAEKAWITLAPDNFDISARPKTLDTLVQKLERETFSLADVQDLSGVRIDADLTLTQQTQLGHEVADHFGVTDNLVRDLRENPHSGYRAVHLWLRCPAGRVEIQIRTVLQSAWANVYERLGDFAGRGIRYGVEHDDPLVRDFVKEMHSMSKAIAEYEANLDDVRRKLQVETGRGKLKRLRSQHEALLTPRAKILKDFDDVIRGLE